MKNIISFPPNLKLPCIKITIFVHGKFNFFFSPKYEIFPKRPKDNITHFFQSNFAFENKMLHQQIVLMLMIVFNLATYLFENIFLVKESIF